jgi:predicted nucleic acid-binding protein
MNVVDTSGWLEYFSDGPNADKFLAPLQDSSSLIIPVITIYEVFKIVLRESSEHEALQAIAAMEKGQVIELTTSIAMTASKLSLQYNLPMADSIILSTSQLYGCTIWTQDSDFKDIPGVNFFPKIANK